MNNQNTKLIKPSITAWTRFGARLVDITLFTFSLSFLAALAFPSLIAFMMNQPDAFVNVEMLFAWVFIETILLSTWGTTPGKWLLQVTVKNENGHRLTLREAFTRSIFVFFFGMGLGLPVVSLFTWLFSYMRLTKNGATLWDDKEKFQVSYMSNGFIRTGLAVLIVLFYFGSNIYFSVFST